MNRSWKKDWAFRTDYQADQIKTLLSPVDYGMKPQRIQTIRVFNSNDLKREYNGLELKWTTKLSSVWTMGGNWTYSRLTGNNNGGDSNTGQSFRDRSRSTSSSMTWARAAKLWCVRTYSEAARRFSSV